MLLIESEEMGLKDESGEAQAFVCFICSSFSMTGFSVVWKELRI
jgi:hypothetical protein